MFQRCAIDVAVVLAVAFVSLMLLTAYRVQNICRQAPQACSAVVVMPPQGSPK